MAVPNLTGMDSDRKGNRDRAVTREQQTPEALAAHQKAEIGKWWPLVKAANIKAQ
jgi:hypothetical protein